MKDRNQNTPASYLIIEDGNKTLLMLRENTGYEDEKYSLIAGHVDERETFTQTIIREAKEEAGVIITEDDMEVVHVMQRKSNNHERVDVFFKAKQWKGEIENCEPHKCGGLHWYEKDKLPGNVIPYIRHVFDCIANGIWYSEFGWKDGEPSV